MTVNVSPALTARTARTCAPNPVPDTLTCLRQLPAVSILRDVWTQQYVAGVSGDPSYLVRWRALSPDAHKSHGELAFTLARP